MRRRSLLVPNSGIGEEVAAPSARRTSWLDQAQARALEGDVAGAVDVISDRRRQLEKVTSRGSEWRRELLLTYERTCHFLAQAQDGGPLGQAAQQYADAAKRIEGGSSEDSLQARRYSYLARAWTGTPRDAVQKLDRFLIECSRAQGRDGQLATVLLGDIAIIQMKELDDAEGAARSFRELVKIRTESEGSDHESTLRAKHDLALALNAAGETLEVAELMSNVLADRRRVLDYGDPRPCTRL